MLANSTSHPRSDRGVGGAGYFSVCPVDEYYMSSNLIAGDVGAGLVRSPDDKVGPPAGLPTAPLRAARRPRVGAWLEAPRVARLRFVDGCDNGRLSHRGGAGREGLGDHSCLCIGMTNDADPSYAS